MPEPQLAQIIEDSRTYPPEVQQRLWKDLETPAEIAAVLCGRQVAATRFDDELLIVFKDDLAVQISGFAANGGEGFVSVRMWMGGQDSDE